MASREREILERIRAKKAFICDMDGVLYHGNRLLPGASEFVSWLAASSKKFLFLTNSSERTPAELQQKLARLQIQVGEEHFYTSALATASFLASQHPRGSAYVIGDTGLTSALYEAGLSMNDVNPDYVVMGDTRSYNLELIERAVELVRQGARLIGANPDLTGPVERGLVPSTGSLIAPIERATGRKAYFVGKPNPLMMRHALKRLDCRREEAVIIGDRLDTDILSGIEAEIDSVLVLSGVSRREDLVAFAFSPTLILGGVGEVPGPA